MSRKRGSPKVRKSESQEEELKAERPKPKASQKSKVVSLKSEEEGTSAIDTPHSEIQNKFDPDSYRDEHPTSEIDEPLTTHNSPLTTMEVHHHPEVEKKGLKEYVLEGLMIFLAVTMGFFAESLREHLADRGKENQYMQAMIVDLQKDSVEINSEMVYTNHIINELDSLFRCLHSPELTDSVQRKLYEFSFKSSVLVGFEFSDAASVQLKNTGDIRLIQSQEVTDAIIHYWQAREYVKEDISVFNRNAQVFWDEGTKIFDFYNIKNLTHPKEKMAGVQIDANARLLTLDKLKLIEYANRVGSLIFSLRLHYLKSLERQRVIESDLGHLINKNYKF